MKSTHLLAFTSALALFSAVSAANADDAKVGLGAGDLLVRVRALGVLPDVSGRDNALHGKIDIGNDFIPELDAAYYFSDTFAGELIAGTTQHKVKDKLANSRIDLGNVWLLPPTLTGQWHPLGRSAFDPYVGAGVNYTIFYDAGGAQTIAAGQRTKVTYKNNFGEALQFGANYQVNGSWFVNVDVKKIFLSTTAVVKLNGTEATRANVRIDPWLVGVGVGYRF
ncbi:OmpW/AlkL family protein [Telmatospirillum siberiense]|uniref:OmpW family protein n=1 Tax=Telmatospirillum siberiense TaxID=382514 RepID=A0A2N3PXX0_9PROT|nr:OmpW family outer membrane protein [Telmatospirillum siberiense]PKU25247.1 OmpW family protein [Telmatospirillum siberiense]